VNINWDDETDVVVVGFGAAGACAAIEAASHGASVAIVERFSGGGATAISGGVVYAGGGTHIQRQAGIDDDVTAMNNYLRLEVEDAVSAATLSRFCQDSAPNLLWLEEQGVPFEASLCPVKTSYPTDDYFLYYSGNESQAPYRDHAKPAPRGHRAKGRSLPGRSLFDPLRRRVQSLGVKVHCHSIVDQLLLTSNGRVEGVAYRNLTGAAALTHGLLEKLAIKTVNYLPKMAKRLRRWSQNIERRFGKTLRVKARMGVILAAGGFIYSRKMVTEYAPAYRRGMPLGTSGCAGLGIQLGQSVGGAVASMNRVSAWRFLNPPSAFTHGVLVNGQGLRFVNESLYGAHIGEAMVDDNGGKGILIVDETLKKLARHQIGRKKTQWFQTAPTLLNLWFNCRRARDIHQLAKNLDVPTQALNETLTEYNFAIQNGLPDAFAKQTRTPLKPPYYSIDCSIDSTMWPLPTLTLGGLVVCEESGQVKRSDGSLIAGLYAAGRTAVGVCSRQYVSGLSIADCVFSGRRAGRCASVQSHQSITTDGE